MTTLYPKIVERVQRVRREREAAGLCMYCGEVPPEAGEYRGRPKKGCRPCLDYFSSLRRAEYDRAARRARAGA